MTSPFSVELVPDRATLIVAARGELDLGTAPDLEAALEEARTAGFERVVLDLSAVTFMDSTGIALVVAASTDRPGRRAVEVEPGTGQPRDVLALSGVLDRLGQVRSTSSEIAPT